MKTIKIFLIAISLISLTAITLHAQVAINNSAANPNASAILDLSTGNPGTLGFLPPTVALTNVNTLAPVTGSGVSGLLVYTTSSPTGGNGPGYYYWNGTAWTSLDANTWQLTGNAGTSPGINYIGTSDAETLEFKVDNQKSGYMDYNAVLAATAFGYEAFNSGGGEFNSAFGYQTLYSNTSGAANEAIGERALYSNTSGSQNTANGVSSLYNNTLGINNTANGSIALYFNTTASSNTATGTTALYNNNADYNTATGDSALYSNTSGTINTATGYAALALNTTGGYNVADGVSALYNNNGSENTANGFFALGDNTTGSFNTANGQQCLASNTTGMDNTANGQAALYNNSTASGNTANGSYALFRSLTGDYNTADGDSALYHNSSGTFNTALGYKADVTGIALTNATVIGANNSVGNSNSTELGNSSVVFCGINGAAFNAADALVVGTGAANGNGAKLTVGGVWTNASDRNKKENFTLPEVSDLLAKINMLPIFEWNYKGEPLTVKHIGPMAQDFYRIFAVGTDSLSISTIDPAGIALAGIQALNQKLEAENKELKTEIKQLAEDQNIRFANDEKEIAELKNLIINSNQAQASIAVNK